MKWTFIFSIACVLSSSALANDPIQVEKPTKRMVEIANKYHIIPILVIPADADSDTEFWEFLGKAPSYRFHVLPVVIRKNATNTEIEAAIIAVKNCAAFYDKMIDEEKAHERPKDQQGI